MKKFLLPFLIGLAPALVLAQSKTITGFTKESAEQELKLEEKFDTYLKASNLDQWMKKMTLKPHHVGSAYGKVNAEFIRDQFKAWGYDAEIETYKILFPTPKVRILEMTAPTKFVAKLE